MKAISKCDPCPFCGSDYRELVIHAHVVQCENCKAFGPAAQYNEDPVDLWNGRHFFPKENNFFLNKKKRVMTKPSQ